MWDELSPLLSAVSLDADSLLKILLQLLTEFFDLDEKLQTCAALTEEEILSEIKSRNSEREAGQEPTNEVDEDSDDPGAIPPRRRTF